MSLAAFALRLCAVRAITGRTLAEGRVRDSEIVPDDASMNGVAPFVIVSTDDARTISEEAGARDFNAPRTVDLAIDIVLASFVKVSIPADETGGEEATERVEIDIAPSDENMEFALDLIERQVWRALSEGSTVWSRLFLKFAPKIGVITSKRGAGAENGTRFTARLITIPVDTLIDPDFGVPASGAWAELVAAMKADPDLAVIGSVLAAEIVGDAVPAWKAPLMSAGYGPDEIAGMGVDGDAAPVSRIAVVDEDGNELVVASEG